MKLDHINIRGPAKLLQEVRRFIPELTLTQLFFEDPAGTGIEVNFPGESGE